MRSVFGPLLLAILPLVAAGCMLPQQSLSLGDRPTGSSLVKGSRKAKLSDEVTFKRPKSAAGSTQLSDDAAADDVQSPTDNEETAGTTKLTFADFSENEESVTAVNDAAEEASSSIEHDSTDGGKRTYSDNHVAVANRQSLSSETRVSVIGQVRFQTLEEEANEQAESEAEDFDSSVPAPSKAEFVDAAPADWDAEPTVTPRQSGLVDRARTASVESSLPMWSDRHRSPSSPSGSSKSPNSSKSGATRLPLDIDRAEIPSGPITVGTLPMLPWQSDLEKLISRIEQELVPPKTELEGDRLDEHIRRHVHLRMLYLMAQRQEQALTAIPGIDKSQQEYWQQLLWAMSNNLDTAQFPELSERAAKTVPPLSGALRQMREQAALSIKNMTFCRKISYFGNYERFPRNEFTPGHEVLLYTEIENFVSALTADGEYRTSLKSLIEIKNSEGQIVWTKGFPSTEDFCRNPRRDYFHNYQFYIPEDLSTGAYSLKLTIVDELSKKRASNSLNFVLK